MGINLPMTHTPPPPDPTPTAQIFAPDVALFADFDSGAALLVEANVNVFEDVGSTVFGVVANAGSGSVELAAGADCGDTWSIGDVVIDTGAIVHGSVRTSGNLTAPPPPPDPVTGAEFTQDPIQLGLTTIEATFPPLPTTDLVHETGSVTITPGSFRHITVNGGTATIQPGSYGNLVVNGGTLILNVGSYTFELATFNTGTTFSPDNSTGIIRVSVMNTLIFRAATSNYPSPNLRFAVFGPGGATLGGAAAAPVFRGTVVAMNGPLILEGGAPRTYRGAFFGRTVIVQAGATVQHTAFAGWEAPAP